VKDRKVTDAEFVVIEPARFRPPTFREKWASWCWEARVGYVVVYVAGMSLAYAGAKVFAHLIVGFP